MKKRPTKPDSISLPETARHICFHKSFKNHSQFFYFFTTVSSHFPRIVILNKGQQPFSYKLFFFILPGHCVPGPPFYPPLNSVRAVSSAYCAISPISSVKPLRFLPSPCKHAKDSTLRLCSLDGLSVLIDIAAPLRYNVFIEHMFVSTAFFR